MLEPLPTIRPPQRDRSPLARDLPAGAAFDWLAAGWHDLRVSPWSSLAYGAFVLVISYAVLIALHAFGMLYLALPAISGFLIIAPFLAIGLYEKSRRIEEGRHASLGDMEHARSASGAQLAYAGLFLGLLVLFWLRVADLLYALYFGVSPFPGVEEAFTNVLVTPSGWALIITGCLTGGLFAAFAFALSLFSIPMMVAERRDALTALGLSFAMTARNARPCIVWGMIVTLGIMLSVVTGFLGLVVIFPVLGHGTWHAWRAVGAERP